MSEPIRYADPIRVDDPAQCQFYHRMEIPGLGEVGTQWDLRRCILDYLGKYDFAGKRVLDVGAASGFLTFTMENLGAEVVSFDMADGAQWDVVPQDFVRNNYPAHLEAARESHRRLQNAYWYSHARLGSQARVFYGDIYRLPEELGLFDVGVMGMIIGHLRDPFKAIYNVARLCKRHLIITNQIRKGNKPVAFFMPSHENRETQVWWFFSESCIVRMLDVMGFKVIRKVKSKPRCLAKGPKVREDCYAFVAERVD